MRLLAVRFLCLVSLSVWVGGFVFYSAAVIPVLHDEMDHLQAGGITQRVTDRLNGVGGVAVAVWAIALWSDRDGGTPRSRRTARALLSASAALLLLLVVLHLIMDRMLEGGSLRGFYPWHRAYLIASTVQWVTNLGLLAASLVIWSDGAAGPRPSASLGDEGGEGVGSSPDLARR